MTPAEKDELETFRAWIMELIMHRRSAQQQEQWQMGMAEGQEEVIREVAKMNRQLKKIAKALEQIAFHLSVNASDKNDG